jgi:catechol 2,3-dioxygenase-like lactoylglutathione lyase family enzyme
MFLGLRSVIYSSKDLADDKAFWTKALGIEPYFDQPFYVGFSVKGYEIGLDPNAGDGPSPRAYIGVDDIENAVAGLLEKGIKKVDEIHDVGDGIKMCLFESERGQAFGVIENPHFKVEE